MAHYADFRMADARGEFHRSLRYRWNWKVFNYLLRSHLPKAVVRNCDASGWAVDGRLHRRGAEVAEDGG
jgi:hypothetical protein